MPITRWLKGAQEIAEQSRHWVLDDGDDVNLDRTTFYFSKENGKNFLTVIEGEHQLHKNLPAGKTAHQMNDVNARRLLTFLFANPHEIPHQIHYALRLDNAAFPSDFLGHLCKQGLQVKFEHLEKTLNQQADQFWEKSLPNPTRNTAPVIREPITTLSGVEFKPLSKETIEKWTLELLQSNPMKDGNTGYLIAPNSTLLKKQALVLWNLLEDKSKTPAFFENPSEQLPLCFFDAVFKVSDKNGRNALHHAVLEESTQEKNEPHILRWLGEASEAQLLAPNAYGNHILHLTWGETGPTEKALKRLGEEGFEQNPKTGKNPLHKALERRDAAKANLLAQAIPAHQLAINGNGNTELMSAIKRGKYNIAKTIIDKVPEFMDYLFLQDKDGETPISQVLMDIKTHKNARESLELVHVLLVKATDKDLGIKYSCLLGNESIFDKIKFTVSTIKKDVQSLETSASDINCDFGKGEGELQLLIKSIPSSSKFAYIGSEFVFFRDNHRSCAEEKKYKDITPFKQKVDNLESFSCNRESEYQKRLKNEKETAAEAAQQQKQLAEKEAYYQKPEVQVAKQLLERLGTVSPEDKQRGKD